MGDFPDTSYVTEPQRRWITQHYGPDWDKPREYQAVIGEPIEVTGSDPEQAEFDALSKISKVIEGVVVRHLPVWFNFTPAWGTP